MPVRPPFDIRKPLVAAREFTFAGDQYKKGEPFPRSAPAQSFNRRLISRQYEAGAVNHRTEEEEAAESVQMTGPAGGRYTITAPWLENPEVIRGKHDADARFAELRDAGPPLGFIAGGSEVTVEETGGGWFEVNAPWLDEPEKIQGRDAAEERQRVLHESKPEDFQPADADADDHEGGDGDQSGEGSGETGGQQPGGEGGDEQTGETGGEGSSGGDTGTGADQGGENAGGAENASGAATEASTETTGDGDPHKGEAEKIAGTGPAKAADDVAAAAGQPAGRKRGSKPADE